MKNSTYSLALIMCMLLSCIGFGQVENEKLEVESKRHRVMAVLSHTHVPEGYDADGDKAWIILGSWGVDYDYRLSERWSLGVHTDMILENFVIERNDGNEVERSRPIAAVLASSYKFGEHFALVAGAGGEFSKEEDYGLVRLGGDYGWEIPGDWELALSAMLDIKIEGYNSVVFGVGVGKLF